MAKDYYKILGLSKSASQDEIKSAYHKLAHKHHPDKAGGEEAKFKEINEAYSVLSDPDKRKRYDSFGAAFSSGNARGFNSASWNFEDFPFTANGNAADFGDFGDIFEEFFGFGQPKKKTTTGRGKDIVVDAEISLEEAYSGINKHLIINMLRVKDVMARAWNQEVHFLHAKHAKVGADWNELNRHFLVPSRDSLIVPIVMDEEKYRKRSVLPVEARAVLNVR